MGRMRRGRGRKQGRAGREAHTFSTAGEFDPDFFILVLGQIQDVLLLGSLAALATLSALVVPVRAAAAASSPAVVPVSAAAAAPEAASSPTAAAVSASAVGHLLICGRGLRWRVGDWWA